MTAPWVGSAPSVTAAVTVNEVFFTLGTVLSSFRRVMPGTSVIEVRPLSRSGRPDPRSWHP